MRKTLILILFIFVINSLKAQFIDDSYDWYPRQWGLKVGLNSITLNASKNQAHQSTATSSSKIGWSASAAYWIPITQLFRPRLELSFDALKANVDYKNTFKDSASYAFAGETSLNHFSFAILPELVFGKHIQFSIYAGFQVSVLMSANQKGVATTIDSAKTITSVVSIDQKNNGIAEDVDSGLLTGFGVRYMLTRKLLLHAESRFRFGTTMVYSIYKHYYWGASVGIIYQL